LKHSLYPTKNKGENLKLSTWYLTLRK